MNINKRLNEVQQYITDKKNEVTKKVDMMENLIEQAKSEKIQAENNSKIAFEATDVNAYHAAQKQIRIADDEVAMYTAKLQEIKNTPLMTKEEYDQIAGDIITALEELSETESNKLRKIIDEQFIPISESFYAAVNRANDYLNILVFEFLKLKEGTSILANTRKLYRDYSISGLVSRMKESEVYTRGDANE